MSSWSNNNQAHVQTWYTLFLLDQLQVSFKEAEGLQVDDLTFWSATASDDLRNQQADSLGVQLDNMFRNVWNARYEEGVERQEAVRALQAILRRGEESLPTLGATADQKYAFLGEITHDD